MVNEGEMLTPPIIIIIDTLQHSIAMYTCLTVESLIDKRYDLNLFLTTINTPYPQEHELVKEGICHSHKQHIDLNLIIRYMFVWITRS